MGQRQTKNTSSFGDTGNEIPPEVSFDDLKDCNSLPNDTFSDIPTNTFEDIEIAVQEN